MKQAYLISGYCEHTCSECGVKYTDNEYFKYYSLDKIIQYTGYGVYTNINDEPTGLFEGDICTLTEFDINGKDTILTGKITEKGGSLVFESFDNGATVPLYFIDAESDIEIIGNIYDNPELMKE